MSQRIKLILATSDRIAIVNAKEGKIEAQLEMDAEIDRTAPVKLFSIPQGYGVLNKNKVIGYKLKSNGEIDYTFQPCKTMENLIDIT